MNRGICAVLALMLACQQQTPSSENITPVDVVYPDGIFRGEFSAFDSSSWKPFLEIMIRGGRIVSASWDEVNHTNEYKSQNRWYAETMKKHVGMTPSEVANELIDRLVARNAADIDTITGATQTSVRFKRLAEAILENVMAGRMDRTVLPMDDTYSAETERDADNHLVRLTLTFQNNRIVEARLDRIGPDDVSYREGGFPGSLEWSRIATELERQLLEKQEIEMVNAPPGGEALVELMRGLTRRILQKRDYR